MKKYIFCPGIILHLLLLGNNCLAELSYPDTVHCPANNFTVQRVKEIQPMHYAEIGLSDGKTVLSVAKVLPEGATIYLFDFEEKVKAVEKKLIDSGFKNVVCFGNGYKYKDSYCWSFLKLLRSNSEPIFDYVFLDGTHMWDTDALAFFLIDRLLKVDGYIDFDDYNWKMINSGTCAPRHFPLHDKMWTREQMSTACVKDIIELLVKPDKRYKHVRSSGGGTSNYLFVKKME